MLSVGHEKLRGFKSSLQMKTYTKGKSEFVKTTNSPPNIKRMGQWFRCNHSYTFFSHYTWPGKIKPYTSTQNACSRSSLIWIPVSSATEHTLAATFHPLPLFLSFSETSLDVAGILLCYRHMLRSLYSSHCSTLDLYFAPVLKLGRIIPHLSVSALNKALVYQRNKPLVCHAKLFVLLR